MNPIASARPPHPSAAKIKRDSPSLSFGASAHARPPIQAAAAPRITPGNVKPTSESASAATAIPTAANLTGDSPSLDSRVFVIFLSGFFGLRVGWRGVGAFVGFAHRVADAVHVRVWAFRHVAVRLPPT